MKYMFLIFRTIASLLESSFHRFRCLPYFFIKLNANVPLLKNILEDALVHVN